MICQRPKVEEAIWAALQKLPVGQSSCHEDCQASWWFGRDHAVAGARAVDDLVVVLDGCSRRLSQHVSRHMRSPSFVPAIAPAGPGHQLGPCGCCGRLFAAAVATPTGRRQQRAGPKPKKGPKTDVKYLQTCSLYLLLVITKKNTPIYIYIYIYRTRKQNVEIFFTLIKPSAQASRSRPACLKTSAYLGLLNNAEVAQLEQHVAHGPVSRSDCHPPVPGGNVMRASTGIDWPVTLLFHLPHCFHL